MTTRRSSTVLKLRQVIAVSVFLMVQSAQGAADAAPATAQAAGTPRPKITVSKQTTYVTGPLRPDGYVDYVAAINARYSRGVTVENNAAVLLCRALGPGQFEHPETRSQFFRRLGIAEPPKEGHYLKAVREFVVDREGDRPLITETEKQLETAQRRPWSKEEFPLLAEWLGANEEPLRLVVEASRRPKFFAPVAGDSRGFVSLLEPISGMRTRDAAQLLVARAMLRLHEGKTDEAWQDLLACHRLARLMARGPFLISCALASVIEARVFKADAALAQYGKLTAEQARRFQADLQQLPAAPAMAEVFDAGERMYQLDFLCLLANSQGDLPQWMGFIHGERWRNALGKLVADPRVNWDDVLRESNASIDQIIEAFRLPTYARQKMALKNLDDQREAEGRGASDPAALAKTLAAGSPRQAVTRHLIRLLFLPSGFNGEAVDPLRTSRLRLAELAFALAGYRSDHGRYPPSLKDLSPAYIAEVPKDPFTGEDLHYRTPGAGYLLYSVGPNGRDDGGKNTADDGDKWLHETDASKIPDYDDIAIRTPEEKP